MTSMTELEQNILEVISDYHDKTDGKCGISAVKIAQKLGLTFLDIKDDLNYLYENKKFIVKPGINTVLIFKN